MSDRMVILAGSGCPELSLRTAQQLKLPLSEVAIDHFADGELSVWIKEDVNKKHVIAMNSLGPPVHEHFMELLLLCDAARGSGASSVTAIIPYYGYGRQDRQSRPGEPISAEVVARCLEASGVTRVIALDVHSEMISQYFTVPFIPISGVPVLASALKAEDFVHPVVIAPDGGASDRAAAMASILACPVAIAHKRRDKSRHDTIMSFALEGRIEGETAIIIDDVISTGGTIHRTASLLAHQGMKTIIVCATHYLGLAQARSLLSEPHIAAIYVTDSLPQKELLPAMKVISVAVTLADSIRNNV